MPKAMKPHDRHEKVAQGALGTQKDGVRKAACMGAEERLQVSGKCPSLEPSPSDWVRYRG